MYSATSECHLIVINKDDSHEAISAPTPLSIVTHFLRVGPAGRDSAAFARLGRSENARQSLLSGICTMHERFGLLHRFLQGRQSHSLLRLQIMSVRFLKRA